jgi:hypothetical protein
MKRLIGLAGAFALAVALSAFYSSVAPAQPQGGGAQASPSAAETPIPVPPSYGGGPYEGHPFAHPTHIPKPWENGIPPKYKTVPQGFPGLPEASPTPTPKGTPGSGDPSSFLHLAHRVFASLDLFPEAFAQSSCEGVYPSLQSCPSCILYDCDSPAELQTQFEGGGPGAPSGAPSSEYWIPPDTDGAVGSSDVVTYVNGAVYVWGKSSGALVTETSATSFWCPHYNFPSCNPVDPRILHDTFNYLPGYSDPRWVASSLLGLPGAGAAHTLLAVSPGEDPTSPQTWHFYYIQSCPDASSGDQPRLGFNEQWIVVFVDCHNGMNEVAVFDKANLYTGGTLVFGSNAFIFNGSTSFQQPAVQGPSTSLDEFLVGVNDRVVGCGGSSCPCAGNPLGCYSSLTFNSVQIGLVSGPVGAPTYNPSWHVIKLPSSGYVAAPARKQLGTNVLVGNEPALVNSAVVNSLPPLDFEYIYAVFPVGLPASSPSRSGVEWVQMDDLGNLVQSGIIQDTTGVASYHVPSIALDEAGYGLIGYSDFSANYYPRADYVVLDLTLPAQNGQQFYTPDEDLNFVPQTVLQTSATYWTGSSCPCNKLECVSGGAYTCARWGDYSTTVEADTWDLWTIQEYMNLAPAPPPSSTSSSTAQPAAAPSPGSQDIQDSWWGNIYMFP